MLRRYKEEQARPGLVWGKSPEELEGELDLARAGGGAGDGAGGAGEAGGIGGGGRSEDDEVGSVEIGAVEEIENFGAELQVEALADGGVFQHGKIPSGQGGTGVGVAANVAVEAAEGGRSDEGSGIEPPIGIAEDDRAGELGIQERTDGIAGVAIVGRVVAELRGEGKAGL